MPKTKKRMTDIKGRREKSGKTITKAERLRSPAGIRLIDSMDLDEMLEASRIAEMGIRGERIPDIKSPKVQKYVGTVLKLNESTSTKQAAQRMQQDLTVEIINTNRRTSDEAEGKRLYRILMDEE